MSKDQGLTYLEILNVRLHSAIAPSDPALALSRTRRLPLDNYYLD